METPLSRVQAALQAHYRVDRSLGAGGMATVYLAWDLRHDRPVAIKVLHPDLANAVGSERFEREIKVAARLSHPHILTLHDSGSAGGLLYYVMPYVEGESLRDRLDRQKVLPLDEAVEIAREVADALAYAHNAGVIHRDIKPENILLSAGHALVADFGIARAMTAAANDRLTHTGTAIGTPQYMSPEQSLDDDIGPPSDVYSLGCVLYEMLAGAPPFTGPTGQAIMARHSLDPVPPLRTVRATVPEELQEVVLAALNKLPADRPQTAARFRDMLAVPLNARRNSGARPISGALAANARRRSRVPRILLVGATATIAVLGAFTAWKFAFKTPAPDARAGADRTRIAVLYFSDLTPGRELGFVADGLTDGLIDALSGVTGLSVVSRGGVAPYRSGNVARDSIARILGVGTLVTGTVERELDSVLVTLRVLDDAGIELERASFRKASGDFVGLADSLPVEAARMIRQRLGRTVTLTRTRAGSRNTDAWALFQRASQARVRGDSLFNVGDQPACDAAYAAADSMATRAAQLDPKWVEPVILRGLLQYWRSRRTGADREERVARVEAGLAHVNRALEMDPQNADALELRGNLGYWRWLARADTAAAMRASLLATAQRDLEAAANATPPRAGAWASLSHLYYQVPNKSSVDILFAATKALELDAYLSNADVVFNRLFLGSYDAEKLDEANRWCRQAHVRFPTDPRFVTCALWLAPSDTAPANPRRAWAILDSVMRLTADEEERRSRQMEGTFLVAGVLGRAGLRDSARRVLIRTPVDTILDRVHETFHTRAYGWLLAGDRDSALATLKVYYDTPQNQRGVEGPAWWFRSLADDARYRTMVGPRGG